MSATALETLYRQEYIAKFEKDQTLLRKLVTTETVKSGGAVVFTTVGSGSAEAVTRGGNGLIAGRNMDLDQYTANLVPWYDKPQMPGFNVFAAPGDILPHMRRTSIETINRKIDKDIEGALSAATNTWGAAATASLGGVTKAITKLRNNFVGSRIRLGAVISPAYYGYLCDLAQFTSADYVQDKRFEGVGKDEAFDWRGVTWVVNPDLEGVGSGSAQCYMFAREAIGHACDVENMTAQLDYEKEHDYSYAICKIYMASKLLQNSGVIKMPHIDTAYS